MAKLNLETPQSPKIKAIQEDPTTMIDDNCFLLNDCQEEFLNFN